MPQLSGNGLIVDIPSEGTPNLCTRYKGRTQIFELPVLSGIGTPGGPKTVGAKCERRYSNIIDNHLYGAISAHRGDGYFRLGNFGFDQVNGQVALDEVQAYISDTFVENLASEFAIWSGVQLQQEPYLFIGLVEESETGGSDYKSSLEFGHFTTRSSTSSTILDNEIIIGKIVSGNNSLTVTTSVPGKKEWKDLYAHVFDDSPHGGAWYQDQITVSGVHVWRDLELTGTFTVIQSGVYTAIPNCPGTFEYINSDWYVNSGIEIGGRYTHRDIALFYNRSKHYSQIFADVLTVDSGLNVYCETTVNNTWEFNNSHLPSGFGFSLINITDKPYLTSQGKRIGFFDPSIAGTILDLHSGNYNNPHFDVASGINSVGVLSILGDTLVSGLSVSSGIALDGIDLSYAKKLITGTVISTDHQHLLLPPTVFNYNLVPFDGVVTSGYQPGYFYDAYDVGSNRTYYSWQSISGVSMMKMYVRERVPEGVRFLSGIEIYHRITSGADVHTNLTAYTYDTNGVLINWQRSWNQFDFDTRTSMWITSSGTSTFQSGRHYVIEMQLQSLQGCEVQVSDIISRWIS